MLDSITIEARKAKAAPSFIRTFFVIDGHAMIHRAYHSPTANLSTECPECSGKGIDCFHKPPGSRKECSNCNGTGKEPTKATYVFTRALLKLCRERKPDYLCFTVDGPREELRRKRYYPEYKANRPEGEWELKTQARRIRQIVRALGIPVVSAHGYEADDVIATLVDAVAGIPDLETLVVSRDKDMAQLIGQGVRMFDAIAEEYLDGRWVLEKFGVYPHQMVDYLSMVGDSGDNIKGVPGIGEKGAAAILKHHTSVKAIYHALDNHYAMLSHVDCAKPMELLRQHREAYNLSKRLIKLERDCELEGIESWEDLAFKGLRMKKAAGIFRSLGFQRWAV